ncbi:oxidoreductase [Pantoea sp. Ap-967]|uniref:PDR/VanB family oxidoreductase n=1 Tax=Pantoea sp. Ap-967 TaxID=2608362 RepID=UPI00141DA488|nr:PDR/VanB family oxidoreductase [Pantoea sp. Ap-967]NIE72929.1 oxidoreductase [Pantoea sp. Ap-967]
MLKVQVFHKKAEALDISSFELRTASGAKLPPFTAGAHIDVHLPNGIIRQYSLCNSPTERHRYVISVLKDSSSRGGSVSMHTDVDVGGFVLISEPRNLFPIDKTADKHLLFAGGIGITPILAMAHALHGSDADFELHYCYRAADRAAFIDYLKAAEFSSCVHLHDDSSTDDQRLNAKNLLANPEANSHLYVCGPGGFMNHILDTAASCGWPERQIHREFFAAEPVSHDGDHSFEVELARSGQVFQIPTDRTVFEVLDECGIEIPSSCEQGVCGSCITRVLDGIPEHRDQFMTAAEHALNDQFTPCCSRSKSPRLVLDL